MSESLDIDTELLWSEDPKPLQETLDSLVVDRLEAETLGIAIAAPSSLVAVARDRLPIACVYTATLREAKTDRLREQLLVIASCVETREVVVGTAYAPLESLPEPLGDDDDPGEGSTGLSLVIDAFERLDIPREPATWIVRLALRDRWSNALTIQFAGDARGYRDEEVERFLAARRAKSSPTQLRPAPGQDLDHPYPAYGDDALDAAEPPAELGFALTAPRVFVRDGAPCVLRGSFRLEARERDLVDFDIWREAAELRHESWQGMAPSAVLPVSLVVIGSEFAGPRVVRLALPSYDPLGTERTQDDGSNVYTGRFAIDLEAIGALMGEPQTNFVYAYAGGVWSEPCLVGLVTPSMLPETERRRR